MSELMMTVWGNALFGCELAVILARRPDMTVMLFDADLLAPAADIFLGVSKSSGGIESLFACTDRRRIRVGDVWDASCQVQKGFHVLKGNTSIENYEYY
ncbi:MAG TPA: hypothetical protein DD727_03290, partial [Clostridiales bacterium]|nr:hypothetical protein [Clostridiales bacterium]